MIKLRHLGDVLLSTPLISLLKEAMPRAEVDALVYADTRVMLEGHPSLTDVLTIDKDWKRQGIFQRLANEIGLLRQIRARRYDLVINLTEGDRGAIAAWVSGARWRVGLEDPHGRSLVGRTVAFTHYYRTDMRHRHQVEQHLDAARRIGIPVAMNRVPLTFTSDEAVRARATSALESAGWTGGDYALIHPTSRWMFKCLAEEVVAALIDGLKSIGLQVVVTAAPDARERAMLDGILARCRVDVVDLGGQLDLKALGAVIAGARVFIGADSVPMHLAAALQIPTVAWFGPSITDVWHPWLVAHRLIFSDVSCRPCGLDGCGGGKRSECLMQIDADRLLAAVRHLL